MSALFQLTPQATEDLDRIWYRPETGLCRSLRFFTGGRIWSAELLIGNFLRKTTSTSAPPAGVFRPMASAYISVVESCAWPNNCGSVFKGTPQVIALMSNPCRSLLGVAWWPGDLRGLRVGREEWSCCRF